MSKSSDYIARLREQHGIPPPEKSDAAHVLLALTGIISVILIVLEVTVPLYLNRGRVVGIPSEQFGYVLRMLFAAAIIATFIFTNSFLYFLISGLFLRRVGRRLSEFWAIVTSRVPLYVLGISVFVGAIGVLRVPAEYYVRQLNCLSGNESGSIVGVVSKIGEENWYVAGRSITGKKVSIKNVFFKTDADDRSELIFSSTHAFQTLGEGIRLDLMGYRGVFGWYCVDRRSFGF